MSCCNTCGSEIVVNVPGVPGDAGTNGLNASTVLTVALTLPAAIGDTVTAFVGSSLTFPVGSPYFISDGTNIGTFKVISFPSTSAAVLEWLGGVNDSAPGTAIAIGATVSPTGFATPLSAALPTVLTDNTTGSQSNTLAAGVGILTIPLWVNLSGLTNANILTTYVPGYAFKVLEVSFGVQKAVTTAAKLATVTPYISGVSVTGGALSLTSANCTPKGTVVAASAITAANTGSAGDSISLIASAVTAFVEGDGWIFIKIQNMDDANAAASLAKHINDLITALTP